MKFVIHLFHHDFLFCKCSFFGMLAVRKLASSFGGNSVLGDVCYAVGVTDSNI